MFVDKICRLARYASRIYVYDARMHIRMGARCVINAYVISFLVTATKIERHFFHVSTMRARKCKAKAAPLSKNVHRSGAVHLHTMRGLNIARDPICIIYIYLYAYMQSRKHMLNIIKICVKFSIYSYIIFELAASRTRNGNVGASVSDILQI